MTHEDYLDEPGDTVDWLIALALLEREIEADRQRKEEARASR